MKPSTTSSNKMPPKIQNTGRKRERSSSPERLLLDPPVIPVIPTNNIAAANTNLTHHSGEASKTHESASAPLNLDAAVARRTDWTPVKDSHTEIVPPSPDEEEEAAAALISLKSTPTSFRQQIQSFKHSEEAKSGLTYNRKSFTLPTINTAIRQVEIQAENGPSIGFDYTLKAPFKVGPPWTEQEKRKKAKTVTAAALGQSARALTSRNKHDNAAFQQRTNAQDIVFGTSSQLVNEPTQMVRETLQAIEESRKMARADAGAAATRFFTPERERASRAAGFSLGGGVAYARPAGGLWGAAAGESSTPYAASPVVVKQEVEEDEESVSEDRTVPEEDADYSSLLGNRK